MRIFTLALVLALSLGPAMAQEPTVADITAEANGLISVLKQQRDTANDQLAQALAQIGKLTRELEAAKAAAGGEKK